MPNLDGTGPQGKGPQTGRGLGNCSPDDKNLTANNNRQPFGQRAGLGLGSKQGARRRRI
jgi:hypothetical protein